MSHVGVKSFRSGDGENYCAKDYKRMRPVQREEIQRIPWVDRLENLRLLADLHCAHDSNCKKPDQSDGAENSTDLAGAIFLKEEQAKNDYHRQRYRELGQPWFDDRQTLGSAEHRDRRRNDAVPVEKRGADQADRRDHDLCPAVRVAIESLCYQ